MKYLPKLNDKQAKSLWESTERKIAKFTITEQASALMAIAVGRDIKEIAAVCDKSPFWVRERLMHSGVDEACETNGISARAEFSADGSQVATGGHNKVRPALTKIVSDYAPEPTSKEFGEYVEHYTERGYTPDVAKAVAKAEWAGETAIEKGIIKPSAKDKGKKTREILFPNSQEAKAQNNLEMHMLRVKAAAKFLDECNMKLLRKQKNADLILEAGELFAAEVERITAVTNS